jgi:hypothetical protein
MVLWLASVWRYVKRYRGFLRENAVDESKTIDHLEVTPTVQPDANPVVPMQSEVDNGYEAWVSEPVPQYAIEAYDGFIADLKELMAHREANPADKWVAYRGRQRLGFGSNQTPLHNECLAKFADGKFCVYHIGEQPHYSDMLTVV